MEHRRNEARLEPAVQVSDFELRLGEAWTHRAEGRSGPALLLLQDLKREAPSLPQEQGHFISEIEILERGFDAPLAREEVRRLLADAERNCHGGKPSLAVHFLDEARCCLSMLPKEGTSDLREEYQRLHERYEALRQPALDRFHALMESFTGKISARIGELRVLSRTDSPLPTEVLRNLLDQALVAQGILASLDPVLIGCQDHEGAARKIGVLREILLEHLERGAGAAPLVNHVRPKAEAASPLPVTPARAPALAVTPLPAPLVRVTPLPAPTPVEKRDWELSPWATGSWGRAPR